MNIIYIGNVESSYQFLKEIYYETDLNVIGIVSKSLGNYNADHVSLIPFAQTHNIAYLDYKNDDSLYDWLSQFEIDYIFCFGWSHLLREEVLTLPKYTTLGYHPTLLPHNKGRHPIIWTIFLGLKETGSSFFEINSAADEGSLVSQERIKIDEEEDARSLYDKLLKIGKKQIQRISQDILNNNLKFSPQTSTGNYWRKRNVLDGAIDFRMNTISILRLIRALTKPYVGTHILYKNQEYKIWEAQEVKIDAHYLEPGKILSINHDYLVVKTYDNAIKFQQPELSRVVKEGDYL